MQSYSLLCRGGTWKKLGVAISAACAVAFAAGCSFDDYSKTSTLEPACQPLNPTSDAGSGPEVFWTFNGGLNSDQWLDRADGHPLVPGHDGSQPSDAGAPLANPRINGHGDSLALDGSQFAIAALSSDGKLSPEDQFTLAAWVSLPARAFAADTSPPYPFPPVPPNFTWPIVSTLGDVESHVGDLAHCGGYDLSIRFQGPTQGPELVLSYQGLESSDAGTDVCRLHSLPAAIEVPTWALGTGRWHHVAGTYAQSSDGRTQLALYWDGKRVELRDNFDPESAGVITYPTANPALYVGTNATDRTSDAKNKFQGFIDDIAVFSRALTEAELSDFVTTTTTRTGPGNCQWRASESWDNTAEAASVVENWTTPNSPEEIGVVIDDWNWGAGALDAQLWPPKDLQLYDKAFLDANIPSDKAFQFTLASGNDYCTWVYQGRGQDTYEVDLRNPVNCSASSCEVNFHQVDRASVTSEWATPDDDLKARVEGKETFTIQRLDFAPIVGQLPDWTSYGGVVGPQGLCWRLQAYEPETRALWDQGANQWSESVTAVLSGPEISGTRLVADFGDNPVDLSACTHVTIDADLEAVAGSAQYAFAVQDVYGSWRSWDLLKGGPYEVSDLNTPDHSSGLDDSKRTDNFKNFPDLLNLKKVRLFGVQKPWGRNGQVKVTVRGVKFTNIDNEQSCEKPGTN